MQLNRTSCSQGLLALVTVTLSLPGLSQVNFETITFVGADAERFVNYATTRSDAPSYTLHLDKDEALDNYFYINPNTYLFDNSDAEANRLIFDQGDYAVLSQGRFNHGEGAQLRVDDEGVYTLSSWDGETLKSGNYGYWNTPGPFSRFAAAWILPEHFELLEYHSNVDGTWVQRGHALAFFAEQANNLTFELRFRTRAQQMFSTLKAQLEDVPEVSLQQTAQSVTVSLSDAILYPPGSAELSAAGREVVARVARELRDQQDFIVTVKGHTDNVPIRGQLAQRFPSNWELSARRAVGVVRSLQQAGVQPERLRATAMGEYHPIVENDTRANRALNRRTEITLQSVPLAR